jgi:hypothetical protein
VILLATYTANEGFVNRVLNFLVLRLVCGLILLFAFGGWRARCQEAASSTTKQAAKAPEASGKQPELPAQIELLETRVRFETNGDSRKEVHTRVHINSELGVRQFARLTFDYNRSFQQIEFPLVRITHEGGGTVDILPSAIADQPNPAVVNAPAYQDVRVKSVRILGLAPNDILEYRVVTTTSHHPLAPDFWLDHTFDRSGVVSQEIFKLDLPGSRFSQIADSPSISDPIGIHAPFKSDLHVRVSPQTPMTSTETVGSGDSARVVDRWEISPANLSRVSQDVASQSAEPDVVLTTYGSWTKLASQLGNLLSPSAANGSGTIFHKEIELVREGNREESIYDFVSKKILTVDLPLGSTGFRTRRPEEILSSGYATPEDKVALFSALYRFTYGRFHPVLVSSSSAPQKQPSRPSIFNAVLIEIERDKQRLYLEPSVEVAPFAMVRADFRGKHALAGYQVFNGPSHEWEQIPRDLPFPSSQRVKIDAAVGDNGTLSAKVKYTMRGDNELLLRVAFHQAPNEKWKEVAQLLALSDGFRGKITDVTASDPYATKEPFTVEYAIVQPKFVDWAKKPVRIPALLPQLGLPDSSAKPGSGTGTSAMDLGTPLDVETHLTLQLPAGTSARTPTGTSVERDYATFASKYAASGATVTATRHLNFLLREVQGDRAADYNAFVRAVQGDEAQEFMLERGETAAQPAKPENSAKQN